jgi:hypothetical protein
MLHPALLGIDLRQFPLLKADDILFAIKQYGPGTGGSLIQCQNEFTHDVPPHVPPLFVFTLFSYYIKKMKNNISLFMAAAFSVLVLEAACTGGPAARDGATDKLFKLRNIRSSAPLNPEQPAGSPRLKLELSLLEVSGPDNMKDFFAALLYDGLDIAEYGQALLAEHRETYREISDSGEGTPGEDFPPLDWEYTEQMAIESLSGRWLVIGRWIDAFTGGAHGMSYKTFSVVDRKDLRVLSWEELFTDPQGPELRPLILAGLREYTGLNEKAPLSSGIYFEDEPAMTANFFLSREGLGFHWNPYEIAPYSEGHIEVIIPWEKLEPLLSEYGRETAAALNR